MFARIRVPGSPVYQALLVPDSAISSEQIRKFVMVVGPDNVVANKHVTLGQLSEGLRVVKDGLSADDRIIVNGLMRARAGQKVTPEDEKPAAAAAAPVAPQANPSQAKTP
jgi:multidrug efflux pump subunit AcrA (membrane-fusion protein)